MFILTDLNKRIYFFVLSIVTLQFPCTKLSPIIYIYLEYRITNLVKTTSYLGPCFHLFLSFLLTLLLRNYSDEPYLKLFQIFVVDFPMKINFFNKLILVLNLILIYKSQYLFWYMLIWTTKVRGYLISRGRAGTIYLFLVPAEPPLLSIPWPPNSSPYIIKQVL